MIKETSIKGKNGRVVRVFYKYNPWREYIDEFVRDDLDYMEIQITDGIFASINSARNSLNASIKNSRRKGISARIINNNLYLVRG